MKTPRDTAVSPYRTLDLVRAVTYGWASAQSLSGSESQILTFVTLRGKRNEPGMAFAWFPHRGQEWWAALLGMSGAALKMALGRLRRKGLIVTLRGSAVDPRFFRTMGYGIPTTAFHDIQRWVDDREEILKHVDDPAPVIPESIGSLPGGNGSLPESNGSSHRGNEPILSDAEKVTAGYFQVTNRYLGCPTALAGVGLQAPYPIRTRDEYLPREEPASLTATARPPGGPSTDLPRPLMKHQGDSWDTPRDGGIDDFDAPRDQKPDRVHRPATRIADVFWDTWTKSRQKRVNLPLPWSSKAAFLKRINGLLKDQPESEVLAMVAKFFMLVDVGTLIPQQEELWRDFWYQRAKVYKLVLQDPVKMSREEFRAMREIEIERNLALIAKGIADRPERERLDRERADREREARKNRFS